jgi:hypothetical protein
MSTMPYWLAKTPEMIAMDKWFSAGSQLAQHYNDAITSINTSKQAHRLPTSSDALNSKLPGAAPDAFFHLGTDWLNPNNPTSGGRYWPHVPTFMIISWFQTGVLHAAYKGLGWTAAQNLGQDPAVIFKSETRQGKMDPSELDSLLPLVTTWVCTSPPGTGTVEVDAVRGPTVVELVIATPQPKLMYSRIWSEVQSLIDEQWVILHGGEETINLVEHDDYVPPVEEPQP